jgi:integrase
MKKKYEKVREGVRKILRWDNERQRWMEPKRGKFEASKTIEVGAERKRIFKTCQNMVEVKAFLENTVTVEEPKPEAEAMLFRELVTVWKTAQAPHLFVTTRENIFSKLKHAESFFNGWMVMEIDSSAIDQWLAHLKNPDYLKGQKVTRLGYNEEYQALRHPLTYYMSRMNKEYRLPFLRQHKKMLKVRDKPETPPKDMPLAKVGEFLSRLKADVINTKYECIYYMAAIQYSEAGRIQEIAPLEVEDIEFITGQVRRNKRLIWRKHKMSEHFVQPGLKARGAVAGFSKYSLALVKEWMIRSGTRKGPLFLIEGKHVTYRMIQFRYDKALAAVGIPFRGTHLLRHAALTEHYEIGKDLNATKAKAGHASIAMTQRYAKSRAEAQDQIQADMDDRLNAMMPMEKVGPSGTSTENEAKKKLTS